MTGVQVLLLLVGFLVVAWLVFCAIVYAIRSVVRGHARFLLLSPCNTESTCTALSFAWLALHRQLHSNTTQHAHAGIQVSLWYASAQHAFAVHDAEPCIVTIHACDAGGRDVLKCHMIAAASTYYTSRTALELEHELLRTSLGGPETARSSPLGLPPGSTEGGEWRTPKGGHVAVMILASCLGIMLLWLSIMTVTGHPKHGGLGPCWFGMCCGGLVRATGGYEIDGMGQEPDSHPDGPDGGSEVSNLKRLLATRHRNERVRGNGKFPEVQVGMDLDVADTLMERALELKGGVHRGNAGSGVPGHTKGRRRRRVRWGLGRGLELVRCGIRPRLHI